MTNVAAGNPDAKAPKLFIPAEWAGEGQPPLYTAAQIAALVEAQQPVPSAAAVQWWRSRADEIEAQVAATGSREAMRCYTDMRTLLQAATNQPSPTPQADSQPAPQGEPWYGHHFKEVRRGYWQCSCGKVISEAASTASKSCYPPLPRRHTYDDDGEELFTADQMRAYVDADRAARAQADSVTAPAATPAAASIAWNALRDATDPLGETGTRIMGLVRVFAQRQYEAGLADGRTTPPAQAADSVLEDAARLAKITDAISDYHFALDTRKHGGDAARRAVSDIERILGARWEQGKEAARHAARKQGGA